MEFLEAVDAAVDEALPPEWPQVAPERLGREREGVAQVRHAFALWRGGAGAPGSEGVGARESGGPGTSDGAGPGTRESGVPGAIGSGSDGTERGCPGGNVMN